MKIAEPAVDEYDFAVYLDTVNRAILIIFVFYNQQIAIKKIIQTHVSYLPHNHQ